MADDPLNSRELGHYFAMAYVGLEMVVPIGVGMVLDHYLGWRPWGTAGGAVLGLFGGLYHLIVLSNRQDGADPSETGRKTKS